jgi:hypothetical protein
VGAFGILTKLLNMKFKSCVQWPADCCPSIGNYSEDTHENEAAARAVVDMLYRHGFGGDGKFFPVKAWVESINE